MKAVICPVCLGSGKYQNGNCSCHGCGGRGWIVIHEDIYPPYPNPYKPRPMRYPRFTIREDLRK